MDKYRLNHRLYNSHTGSILIWTVLLGFVLTSVFFFHIMRQRSTIAIQQDTSQILNAKTYLASFVDYVESLDESVPEEKTELDNLKNGVNFDGIAGAVTNVTDEITDLADAGVPVIYYFSGEIFIAWNKCPGSMKGDLLINDFLYKHDASSECAVGQDYDDVVGPITVSNPFNIATLNVPFYYSIAPSSDSTQLLDKKWYMDLKIDLDYGKKVTVKKTF